MRLAELVAVLSLGREVVAEPLGLFATAALAEALHLDAPVLESLACETSPSQRSAR